jgi:endonuclease/exonuclease/phosphatase family metal-dependent hydrolase
VNSANGQSVFPSCQSQPIRVLTYNVRYGSDLIELLRKPLGHFAPGDYLPWTARYPEIKNLIASYTPDLIGLQEMHTDEDIGHIVPLEKYTLLSYHFNKFEYGDAALLFKTDRFEILDSGQIWLGPNSNLPFSLGFKPFAMIRYANWVMLREKNNAFSFLFVNTHFDNNPVNKEMSSDLIYERFSKLASVYPMIVVGDFNSKAVTERYQRLIGSRDKPPVLTNSYDLDIFRNINEMSHPNELIDHILVGGPCKIEVNNWQVDKRTLSTGDTLSDHDPVFAQLQFKGSK